MKKLIGAVVLMALGLPLAAQEPVNDAVIAQIKSEGFQHSAVMDTLSWISDVYGPRLTGSSNLQRAAEWARDQLSKWGLEHVALEPYGHKVRGWNVQRFSLEMTEPQYLRIIG